MKNNQNTLFAISDSTGHITILVKNLRLKSRIYSHGDDIQQVAVLGSSYMILHRKNIAFSGLLDNKIAKFFCEGSFTDEFDFADLDLERFRPY